MLEGFRGIFYLLRHWAPELMGFLHDFKIFISIFLGVGFVLFLCQSFFLFRLLHSHYFS